MIDQLNKKIAEGVPAYVHRAIQPTFEWNTVVGYIAHCSDNALGEPVGILNYRLPVAEQIDSIRPVMEYLNEGIERKIIGADMYATLTTKSDVKYCGKNDVLLWNVLGYSALDVVDQELTVEPGDIVFIPKDTEYKLNPLGHRAFVVFSLE